MKLIGDWTEILGQHRNHGHFGETLQFFPAFQSSFRSDVIEWNPLSFERHDWLIVKLKKTLRNRSWWWCHKLFAFSFPKTLRRHSIATTGMLRSGDGLRQVFKLPNFNIIRYHDPCLNRRFPTSDSSTLHTPNHLTDVPQAFLQRNTTTSKALKPLMTERYPSGCTRCQGSYSESARGGPHNRNGSQKNADFFVRREIQLPEQKIPHKVLYTSNRRLYCPTTNCNSAHVYTNLGIFSIEPRRCNFVSWSTWMNHNALWPQKEHLELIRNSPGKNNSDCQTHSALRDRSECCLHQGASSLNDITAGAASPQNIGTRPYQASIFDRFAQPHSISPNRELS